MAYRNVSGLNLAPGWLTDFMKENEVLKVPELWAFIVETCGVLSWACVVFFSVSLLVGYSRQMSSHFFFYEYLLGHKLAHPYRPAFFFFFSWIGINIVALTTTVAGIYLYKYGYIYAFLAGIAGIGGLFLVVVAYKMAVKVKKEPVFPEYNPNIQESNIEPARQQVEHVVVEALPTPKPKQIGHEGMEDERYEEALTVFGLSSDFTKAELKKKYKTLLDKILEDDSGTAEGLQLHVNRCYEYLLKRCS